jgi:hypothetical protein
MMTRFKWIFIYLSCLYNWIAQSYRLSNFFSRNLVHKGIPLSTGESSIFDPLSFLSWWKPDPNQKADSNVDRIKAETHEKISNQPKYIGYMDFDPMVAAKKLHCDGRNHNNRGRRGGSFLYS